PDSRQAVTAAISAAPIDGRERGRKSGRVAVPLISSGRARRRGSGRSPNRPVSFDPYQTEHELYMKPAGRRPTRGPLIQGPGAADRRLVIRAGAPDERGEYPDLRLERVAEAVEHIRLVSRPIRARQDDERRAEVVRAGPAEFDHAQQTEAGSRFRPAAPRCVGPIHEHDPALDPPRAPLLRDDQCLEARAARPAHDPPVVIGIRGDRALAAVERYAVPVRRIPVAQALDLLPELVHRFEAEVAKRLQREPGHGEPRRGLEGGGVVVRVDPPVRDVGEHPPEVERLPDASDRAYWSVL